MTPSFLELAIDIRHHGEAPSLRRRVGVRLFGRLSQPQVKGTESDPLVPLDLASPRLSHTATDRPAFLCAPYITPFCRHFRPRLRVGPLDSSRWVMRSVSSRGRIETALQRGALAIRTAVYSSRSFAVGIQCESREPWMCTIRRMCFVLQSGRAITGRKLSLRRPIPPIAVSEERTQASVAHSALASRRGASAPRTLPTLDPHQTHDRDSLSAARPAGRPLAFSLSL